MRDDLIRALAPVAMALPLLGLIGMGIRLLLEK